VADASAISPSPAVVMVTVLAREGNGTAADDLVLQRILGHSDIRVTMRYAHFAPDHLEDAIKLNPIANSIC